MSLSGIPHPLKHQPQPPKWHKDFSDLEMQYLPSTSLARIVVHHLSRFPYPLLLACIKQNLCLFTCAVCLLFPLVLIPLHLLNLHQSHWCVRLQLIGSSFPGWFLWSLFVILCVWCTCLCVCRSMHMYGHMSVEVR